MAPRSMHGSTDLTFGVLLKQLRKRAGMTQGDLAAALGYSIALISSLEKAQRRPDLQAVTERFIPALGLQDDPHLAAALIEQAALARGERPPASMTFQRTTQMTLQEERTVTSTHLPAPPTLLIGRTTEVTHLCNRLLGHSGRLLTLVGPPGVGKTTLALAVAERLQPHYRDSAHFVPLAAVSDPLVMATTIIGVVAPGDTSAKPPESRLVELLRQRALLLVLDNLEQIGGAAPLIAAILAECPAVTILATSRERLHLRAEQRFKVPPLELSAAVELFVQRAQAVDVTFEPVPEQEAVIAAICQRLDCLPLALELCAAQLDLLSPVQLLAQLQDRPLDLLVEGSHDLPPRQRTLRTAIEHSYRLLTEVERTLFRRLGVFMAGFDLAAVAGVCGQDQENGVQTLLATLHALIGKSVVRSELSPGGEQRLWLLETLRGYACEQLASSGEHDEIHRYHANYFHKLVSAMNQSRRSKNNKPRLNEEEAHDNLRAALRWLIATDLPTAQQMTEVLYNFWVDKGLLREGRQWVAKVLAADATPTLGRAWVLLTDALLATEQGDYRGVQQAAAESLAQFQRHGDWIGCAVALGEYGWTLIETGQRDRAVGYFEQALVLARQAGDDHLVAYFLIGLATVSVRLGKPMTAILSLVEESATIFRKRGEMDGLAITFMIEAQAQIAAGDYRCAVMLCQEALTIYQRGSQAAWTWYYLGVATWFAGERRQAALDWEEAWNAFQDAGIESGLMHVWYQRGQVDYYLAQDLAQAESAYQQSLHLCRERQNVILAGRALVGLAKLAILQENHQRATQLLGAAQTFFDSHLRCLAPVEQEEYAQALTTVRSQLDDDTFTAAWAEGAQLSLEQAVGYALAG